MFGNKLVNDIREVDEIFLFYVTQHVDEEVLIILFYAGDFDDLKSLKWSCLAAQINHKCEPLLY